MADGGPRDKVAQGAGHVRVAVLSVMDAVMHLPDSSLGMKALFPSGWSTIH